MPTIHFLRLRRAPTAEALVETFLLERVVSAEAGGHLLDICDVELVDVPFGCRTGACGTCRIAVVAGAQYLAEPSQDERMQLLCIGARPGDRLACLVELTPGRGTVEVVLPTARDRGDRR